MSSGFREESNMVRTNKAESNGWLDKIDANRRKRVSNGSYKAPLYPQCLNVANEEVRTGHILMKRIGSSSHDSRLTVCASLAGVGAEESALYPDEPEMALALVRSKYTYMGIAANNYKPGESSIEQGFPVAFGGTFSIPIMTGERFEPGQIVRAELPLPDKSYSSNGKLSRSRFDLSSYPFRPVPEDYKTPGNLLHTHYTHILEEEQKWKHAMSHNSSNVADMWLTFANAKSESTYTTVLLGLYVLLKTGVVKVNNVPIQNPYVDVTQLTRMGGLKDTMEADEVVLRLAQLLGLQESPMYDDIPSEDKKWYNTLGRIILKTVHYDPKNRAFEFGQKQRKVSSTTRNSKNSEVLRGNPAGDFLDRQLNHDKILTGATLQALDEHVKNRIGRVICGANRKEVVDVILGGSHL